MNFRKIKSFLSLLVVFSMLIAVFPVVSASDAYSKYVDFPTGWSKDAMEHAVDNGLLYGRSSDTINPKDNLTRAEMAAIINRVFGATIEADISKYEDVTPDDWYYNDIAKAVNMRTFYGESGSTMNPDEFITREAVFAVIARALVLEAEDESSLDSYPDKDLVSDWAKNSTAILVSKDYIIGNDEGMLCPKSYMTREEFAQMMYNIVKTYYVAEGKFDYSGEDSSLIRTTGVTLENVTIDGDLIIGDGVGYGTVILNNVTINGRLLCRGGEKGIKLTKTKVKEYVVVYDVNGVVHFENYRSESVFNNIREITPATFLKDIGGIRGDSTSSVTSEFYTVSFHNGSNPEAFDSVSVKKDKNLSNSGKTLNGIYSDYIDKDKLPAYNRDSLGHNNLDVDYEHQVNKGFIYEVTPGVWEVFTDETPVTKNIDVYYATKFAVVEAKIPQLGIPYSLELRYDSNSRFVDSLKDALITTGTTLEKSPIKDEIDKKITNAYITLNQETGMVDSYGNILDVDYGLRIVDVIDYDDIVKEVNAHIKHIHDADDPEIIKEILLFFDIPTLAKELVKDFGGKRVIEILGIQGVNAEGLSDAQVIELVVQNADIDTMVSGVASLEEDELIEFENKIIVLLESYPPYIEFLKEFEEKRSTFELKKENTHFAFAVGEAVDEFSFEEILIKLKNKGFGPIINILGEDAVEDMFHSATEDYWIGLKSLIDEVEASMDEDIKIEYTTSLHVPIAVPSILRGAYDNYAGKFIARAKQIKDYDKNEALQKFVNLDWFDLIVGYDPARVDESTGASGYYFRDYMDYYCLLLDTIILYDEALCFYDSEEYDDEEFKEVKKSLTKDFLAFIKKLEDLPEDIENGRPIIRNYTLQDIIDKVDSVNNMLASFGGTGSGFVATDIRGAVDSVKEILIELGEGNLPGGNTLDDLSVLCTKLTEVINSMNENEYDDCNETFNELISNAMDRLDAVIDEIDQTGKLPGDSIISNISVLSKLYNRFASKIKTAVSIIADIDLGSIDVEMDSEKFVDILFGREEDIFNVDSIIEVVKGRLGENEKTGYDNVNKVYVIDQYSKEFNDYKITLQRKFY